LTDATNVFAAAGLDEFTDERPARLAVELGIPFHDLDLLRLALTHRSVIHDLKESVPNIVVPVGQRSNERLEFLGDAVLGYVVAWDLYRRFPDAPEGDLTARRVALVRAERLVSWARTIDLGAYLYLAQGERISESTRDRMLAGAFEALIGAITLDQGIEAAQRFVLRFLEADAETALAEGLAANPKGRLQELLQELYRQPPVYAIVHEEGPAHAKLFTAAVMIHNEELGRGVGGSKRDAEQAAAAAALERLAHPPSDDPGGPTDASEG
jgi:ribonuclease-3